MKTKLFATVAVVALSVSTMAKAETSWFESMTNSVQSWFTTSDQTTPATDENLETYLNEVTIAVPPATGDVTRIEPAAGNEVENIPGAVTYDDEQSFNTEFSYESGSAVAFGDNVPSNANEYADIQPAAGDAEEITDESVIVVEADGAAETAVDAQAELESAMDEFAVETQEEAETVVSESATEAEQEADVVISPATVAVTTETPTADADVDADAEVKATATETTKTTTTTTEISPAAGTISEQTVVEVESVEKTDEELNATEEAETPTDATNF